VINLGGGPGPTPRPARIRDKELIDVTRRRTEEVKRKIKQGKIDEESKRLMNRVKDRIKWYYTDHGPNHIKRVLNYIKKLCKAFDKSSTSVEQNDRKLTDKDKELVDIAAKFHDVGRGLNDGKNHATLSAEAVRENKSLPLDEKERETVANLCQLHSKTDTRAVYGTDDLKKLKEKGILDKRTAYLASILRVADGLDVTRDRAKTNSQNEPSQVVIERIEKSFPKRQAERHKRNWAGHKGINDLDIEVKNSKTVVRFSLRSQSLQDEGTSVAFRVKDTLREFNSSTLGKNVHIIFHCSNKETLTRWYRRNINAFSDELAGMEVSVE